jgi:hypothetical protein
MKQGDHVKVMGIDWFYVFLKEVKGTATLRVGGGKGPDNSTLANFDRSGSFPEANKIGSSAWPAGPMGSRRYGHKASLMMFTFSLGLSR